MIRAFFIILIAAFVLPLSAVMAAVYDNGAPNLSSGNEMSAFLEADDFTLPVNAQISQIRLWTLEVAGGYNGSLWYAILKDNGGQPDTASPPLVNWTQAAGLTRTMTGRTSTFASTDEVEYAFSITPVTVQAGATYWLAVHNGPLASDMWAKVYWEATAPNSSLTCMVDAVPFAGAWTPCASGNEHAFQLTWAPLVSSATAVPALSWWGALLLTCGLVGMGILHRRA